ncbi:MAG: GNAT family N-acetyltransferase [Microbacteriaceae bacterium]|nr:GNAT family N-acetyltransferase [Microbacteriaceae bacterium]
MTADWTLRIPTPADADALAQLHRDTWRDTYTGMLSDELIAHYAEPGLRERQWREQLAEDAAGGASRTVVAELDGRLVGLARARRADEAEAPRPRSLDLLYTRAEVHGLGVGAALLDEVLGDAPAFLWVSEGNARALAFYRRRGFAPETPPVRRWHEPPFDVRLVR